MKQLSRQQVRYAQIVCCATCKTPIMYRGDNVCPQCGGMMVADRKTLSLLRKGPAFRRVKLSTLVTATFTLNKTLTQNLLDQSVDFWKQQGVTLTKELKAPNGHGEPLKLGLRGQGGSLWSIRFEKYKKIVGVAFRFDGLTHVAVRVELPGAYAVQTEDLRNVTRTLEAFERRILDN